MKVSEAKGKICPFMSRPTAVDHQLYYDGGLININCICDDCMAWKWENFMYDPALLNDRSSLIEICKQREISFQNNDSLEKLTTKIFSYENREGYCKRIGK